MKLKSLSVQNFARIDALDIPAVTAPILFACGDNEAGKTSLHHAVRLAMLGIIARVKLKGDADQLIHGGAKKCAIAVGIDDAEYSASITKSAVKLGDPASGAFVPFALDPSAIAKLNEKDFRRLIYTVAGIDSSKFGAEIRASIQRITTDETKVASAMNAAKKGLDDAVKWARSQASEARGAWKAATGETYGASKAAEWEADVPEVLSQDAIRAMQAAINDDVKKLGALEKKLAKPVAVMPTGETIESLQAKSALYDTTKKERETVSARIKTIQETLSSLMSCPHCDAPVKYHNGALLKASGFGVQDKDQAEKLRTELTTLLDQASQLMVQMQEQQEAGNIAAALADADDNRADMERQQATLRAEIDRRNTEVVAAVNAAAQADQMVRANVAAKQAHIDVQEWTAIADEFEPTGVQARFAKQALEPINAALTSLAAMVEWPSVTIGEDMSITSGGLPYCLHSESRQWRIDLMLALAMTHISGVKLIALDRFDVLSPAARAACLDLLCDAVDAGMIESAIVTGTLKAKPDLDGEYFHVVWMGAS